MLCSSGTDRHESENRGHPFRVSVFFSNFPPTYHQGAVQLSVENAYSNDRTHFYSMTYFAMPVTVFMGRQLMWLWVGDTKIHELYTAGCGLYICWLCLRVSTVVAGWYLQGWAIIKAKLRLWGMLVCTLYIFRLITIICFLIVAFSALIQSVFAGYV